MSVASAMVAEAIMRSIFTRNDSKICKTLTRVRPIDSNDDGIMRYLGVS